METPSPTIEERPSDPVRTQTPSDGPSQLMAVLQWMSEEKARARSAMQPEDVFRLENFDMLRTVDSIHRISPERLPRYEQADGPGDYLESDRAVLFERFQTAILSRRNGARDWEILRRRFGLGAHEPECLETIGRHFGLTRERVRQILECTIAFLRELLEQEEAPRTQGPGMPRGRRPKPISMLEWKPGLHRRCA